MSGQIEATRQSDTIFPMTADTTPVSRGIVIAVAAATPGTLDLTTVPQSTFTDPREGTVFGHILSVQSDGGDVYVIFGPTQASVSGANVPNPAATGTAKSGTAGLCQLLPAGRELPITLPRGPGREGTPANGGTSPIRWMGFITKAGVTTTLRIFQSSP